MTTDTVKKELAVETVIGGKTVRMGGIAKGSGMIHPNMGTMLCFLTTDCAISSEMIKSALLETVQVSFNRISVDGDTSTNDTCRVLANGLAGNPVITGEGAGLRRLCGRPCAPCVWSWRKRWPPTGRALPTSSPAPSPEPGASRVLRPSPNP